jgi:drug/metabolite transporter (DMT)-like permease
MNIPFVVPLKSLFYISNSALLNTAFMFLAFYGVSYGSATGGGVIITTFSPLLTFALLAFINKKRLNKREFFGISLGLIGGLIMFGLGFKSSSDFFSADLFFNSGNVFYLLAALSWAFITYLSQKAHHYIHPIHYSFMIALFSSTLLFLLTKEYDIWIVFDQGISFWLALIYLAVLGQSVATTIYFIASGKMGSSQASSFMFLVPLFSVISSYIVLDEVVELYVLLGGVISSLAVLILNKKVQNS